MAYRKRRKSKSGFKNFCAAKLTPIKKARTAGSRSKAATRYVKCLNRKGIKTGLKEGKNTKKGKLF